MRKFGYERVKEHRQRIKERLVRAFGGKCGKCGYDTCLSALDFHHLDPSEKDFNIRKTIRKWEMIVREARKCVCLCCRCHQEYHEGLWEIPVDIARFDEEYATQKVVVPSFCKTCGKEKSNRKSQYCSRQCASEARLSDRWKDVDLKVLVNDKGISYSAIGRMVGVTGNAVKKRAMRQGVIGLMDSISIPVMSDTGA